jgi:plastocyanin
MKMNPWFLAVSAVAAGLQCASAGDITGKITLNGTPPDERVNADIANDPNCGKLHTAPVKSQFYVVGANKELGDVVVYITNLKGKSTGASAAPLVIDQKGCEYWPYIAAAQTGQKIIVRNSDPLQHNVHVTPNASENKESNVSQGPGAPDVTFTFAGPEDFLRFKCDVHAWMYSYVTVVDHPYFSVSGKDGTYKISGVPAGKYTLEAIHRTPGGGKPVVVTKDIEVKDGNASQDFTLDVPK